MDSFLYDDDEVEQLVEEGKLSRALCIDCGSMNTKMLSKGTRTCVVFFSFFLHSTLGGFLQLLLDFVSHSASIPQLLFLFTKALPDLSGKHLVDVGSRIGAVLFGVSVEEKCLLYFIYLTW